MRKPSRRKLKLRWSRTQSDVGYDYTAFDLTMIDPITSGPLKVGRVSRMTGTPGAGETWSWTMTAFLNDRRRADYGTLPTRDAACHKVEERYRAFSELVRHLHLPPST